MLGCLEEDTNIILKTGIKKIKDVNVGDKIFTMKDKNIIESVVSNKIDRGLENTFKIQTDKRNITATDNHLFFSNKILRGSGKIILETEGWKWNPLNELSIGDFILVPKQFEISRADVKTKVYHNYSKRVKPYSNNFYMERIRNIKEIGIRHVYDLSIHNSDNFLAENMVVHNSYPSPVNIPLVNWFEYILVLRKEGKPRIQRVTQEQKDKSKLNFNQFKWASQSIWNIPAERNRTHPCPFPKEIADRLIRLFSFYGDIVFDPFAGSCTTAIVAKMLGRKSISIDISEEYCKMGRKRLNNTEISLDNYAKKPLDNYG